jgi:glycosyltransferase involved in cell wall biosynthesis
MCKKDKNLKFLYSTRERYPTFRVDLTELFSSGVAKQGFSIDWHMQAMNPSKFVYEEINENECVYIGARYADQGILSKIKNQLAGFYHDLKILKYVRNSDYDFVQVRDKIFAGLIGILAAKMKGIPFYYWMSFPYPEADIFRSKDNEVHQPFFMRVFYWLRGQVTNYVLYKLVLKNADFVFVQSDQMLKDVAEKGVDNKKMMPMPMGINFKAVNRDKEPECQLLDIDEDSELLIYLGTMVRVRRIDFLLDMLVVILKSRPNVKLLLVGDAPIEDMNQLKQRVQELGLTNNVIFTGFVPMETGWAYILRSNVCLSPFRPSPILDSTSPTKVVEYLALGKPVVANKHPDQSQVLNSSYAGLAVDYTPEAFAAACIDILSSPGLAHQMGVNGVEYVKQNRTYDVLINKLVNKYHSLLKEAV